MKRLYKISPSIAVSLVISNIRFSEFNLDTTDDPPTASGSFTFDLTNTGLLKTPAASVGDVDIRLITDEEEHELISQKEAKPIDAIDSNETKTVDIPFEAEAEFLDSISDNVCDDQLLTAKIQFSVYEFILGIDYDATEEIPVGEPNCTRFTLEIEGPDDEIEVDSDTTWEATGQNIEEASEIVWDMDDGTTLEGTEVTHAYSERGEYEVTATLKYDGEEIVSASDDVEVILFVIPSF